MIEQVVVVVIGLALAVQVVLLVEDGGAWPAAVAVASSAAGTVLAFRRRHLALILFAAGPLLATLLGWPPIGLWSVACFGAFLLTLRGLPGSLAAVVTGMANLIASAAYAGTVVPSMNTEPSIAAFAGVALASAGSAIHAQQRYWQSLEQRALDAEGAARTAVARGVAEERLRIARDLHDSVGHNIAVVSMRLGSAEVSLPRHADAAREELAAARRAVVAVLEETQQILRVLRVGPEGMSGPEDPVADYTRIPELVSTFRAAGLRVEASVAEPALPVPPTVGISAYRIVQEALTNAHRHGSGVVSVSIEAPDGEGELVIEVRNRVGRAAPAGQVGGGHGLLGMRERAAAVGGAVEAGPRGADYLVLARLPLEQEAHT